MRPRPSPSKVCSLSSFVLLIGMNDRNNLSSQSTAPSWRFEAIVQVWDEVLWEDILTSQSQDDQPRDTIRIGSGEEVFFDPSREIDQQVLIRCFLRL